VLGVLCSLPLCVLVWGVFSQNLGPNPAEALIRATGDWTLRMLCVVLAVTPLRQWLGWPVLARFRRMLGLFVAAYASIHLLTYAWLDMGLDWGDLWADVLQRRFIWVGMTAWVCLLLLSLTSFNAAIRWLGAVRWRRLHRLVYGVAGLAILHFWWMRSGKHNYTEVVVYAVVLGGLLMARIPGWRRKIQ
jgi:sulfoxide reductase heme-binding subunit YedZ